MGEAAAMCLTIVAITTVAVAASPRLGRWLPSPPRPRSQRQPRTTGPRVRANALARGDPTALQVFRL
jgi:hypothetical protein